MALTLRQRILKLIYPLLTRRSKKAQEKILHPQHVTPPSVPFYTLPVVLNNGRPLMMENVKGKKILLVNTASNCGYTAQYSELQQLSEQNKDRLVIIGFPSNDFKEQEKGSDEDIAQFCTTNFGVTFPLAKKSSVVKTAEQNPVFQWLSDAKKNGWNSKEPEWNFSKYLLNENGILTNYFPPTVSPLSKEVVSLINS